MKQFSRTVILFCIFFLSICVVPQPALAQPGDPGDPGGDPDLPIDGGVGVLLVTGVLYGIKAVRNEKNKRVNKLS